MVVLPGGNPILSTPTRPGPSAPLPATISNFLGLDVARWGAVCPPDTVGDVGPTYFIQSVNTSIGSYRKSDNMRVAAWTFDTFMSQISFGNLHQHALGRLQRDVAGSERLHVVVHQRVLHHYQ